MTILKLLADTVSKIHQERDTASIPAVCDLLRKDGHLESAAEIETAAKTDWMLAIDAICTLFDVPRPAGVLRAKPWDEVSPDSVLGDARSDFRWGIVLSGDDGFLSTREYFGGGTPGDEYHGLTIQVYLAPSGSVCQEQQVANSLQHDKELRAICQKFLEGYSCDWNGNNHIGKWPESTFDRIHHMSENFNWGFTAKTPISPETLARDCWHGDRATMLQSHADGSLADYASEAIDNYEFDDHIVSGTVEDVKRAMLDVIGEFSDEEE